MKPKISIIMPVLNGEKYIGEAVESIRTQGCTDYELIVVNDGSTDTTCDRVNAFASRIDVKIIHHAACQGIARSVNDGIRAASGEYIAFLDHDDLWFPTFLETQLTHMEQHPEVGMVHSDFQTIDPQGNIIEASVATSRGRKRVSGNVFPVLFRDSFIVGNSVLIRRECFKRLGGFDENIRWGDYHMWMRIAKNYRVDYTPLVLTKYRQHPTQDSRDFSAEDPHVDPPGLMAIRSILALYPEIRQELGHREVNRRIALLHFDMACLWSIRRMGRNTRICLRKAIPLWPFHMRFYVLYASSLLQPSHAAFLRRIWHAVKRVVTPLHQQPDRARQTSAS